MARPVIDLLRTEWQALAALGHELSGDDWEQATDCPGWSVRDNFSHVLGGELHLLGEPAPEPAGDTPEWVKNPIGEINEPWIAERRGRPGEEVLAEFEAVTERRLAQLEGMSDEEWNADAFGPTGIVPYHEFLNIRVMDAWVHEQDVRRAVGRPGHHEGPVVEHSLARFVPAMGFVVGKKAAAADGASVRFDLSGPQARRIGVDVVDGRAQVVDDVEDPTVTLTMRDETWWCLSLGRWDGETVLQRGDVEIDGDEDLGRRVVTNMGFMI